MTVQLRRHGMIGAVIIVIHMGNHMQNCTNPQVIAGLRGVLVAHMTMLTLAAPRLNQTMPMASHSPRVQRMAAVRSRLDRGWQRVSLSSPLEAAVPLQQSLWHNGHRSCQAPSRETLVASLVPRLMSTTAGGTRGERPTRLPAVLPNKRFSIGFHNTSRPLSVTDTVRAQIRGSRVNAPSGLTATPRGTLAHRPIMMPGRQERERSQSTQGASDPIWIGQKLLTPQQGLLPLWKRTSMIQLQTSTRSLLKRHQQKRCARRQRLMLQRTL